MGDFDRAEPGVKKNESKKIGFVVALSAGLLVLVWFQFFKKGPEAAVASPVTAEGAPVAAAPATPAQSPELVLAALQQDPTATLLRDPPAQDASLRKVPRNPFHMADAWRVALVKPVVIPDATPVHLPSAIPTAPQAVRVMPTLAGTSYKLGSIIRQNGTLFAVVNNKILTVGNVVDKARVLHITESSVILQHIDAADGPTLELTIDSGGFNK